MKIIFVQAKNMIFATLLIILVFISLMLISQRVAFFGFSSYVVLSGSMQPAIYPGDVIVVKKTNSQLLNKGDVVLFEDPKVAGKKITHRIVENKEKDGVKTYYTKGDANQDKDDWNISKNM